MDKIMSHPPLNLPPAALQLRPGTDGAVEVYDPLRKRWVVLTPEEWVRQHFVAYLQAALGFPAALIANEVGLHLNGCSRRSDTVVYDRTLRPLCLVEYKAPTVPITQKVFDQIARYNSVLHAKYLIVSNGLSHYCCRYRPDGGYTFLREIPAFEVMLAE